MFLLKFYKQIFCLFCLCFYVGCSSLEYYKEKPSPKPVSKEVEKSFAKLKRNLKKQNTNRSLKQVEDFISKNKNNGLTLSAYLLKARLLLKLKRNKEACSTYQLAVSLPFSYRNQEEAYFAFSNCLRKEKKAGESLAVLEFLIQSPKESLKTKKRAALAQWNSLKREKGLKKWKIRVLSSLIGFYPGHNNQSLWKEKGVRLIDGLTKKDLVNFSSRSENYDHFEGYLLYKTGLHFWNQKNLRRSSYYFTQSLSSSLSPDLQKKIKFHLNMLNSIKKTNPYSIGVILPLSGPRKVLGQKILRGLHIGFGLEENSPLQLIVMDSKGHPDVARESVKKLLHEYHVIGLIGGVGSGTAETIAEISSQLGIPSILFSQKDNLTKNKPFVFQNALTSRSIMGQLAKTIRKSPLKIKKVAILASTDSYGKEYAKIFSQKFKEEGGVITDIQTYRPGESDFKTPVQKLVNLYDLKKRAEEYDNLKEAYLKKHPALSKRSKKLNVETLLKPKFDFEAIFIPDSFTALKKIEDHLKYYGIKKVYLLGTNLWSEKQISKWSKNRSLVFINIPSLSNESIKSSFFFKTYEKTFSSYPNFFEQQAYNTAVTFKKALQNNVRNRLDLQRQLENLNLIEGALYSFKISKNRSFIHPLVVFMTKDNKVITLDSIPVQ